MGGRLRILQAGDLRLDSPVATGCVLPAELDAIAVQARDTAMRRMFEMALEESVDAVVLAGALFDWRSDLRPACRLAREFHRLDRVGIPVIVAARGESLFPSGLRLPQNVHLMDSCTRQEIGCRRGRLVVIQEETRPHAPGCGESGLIRIVTDQDSAGSGIPQIEYVLGPTVRWVHPVTPIQGGSPNEPGPHGVTLITHSETDRVHAAFRPIDSVRWWTESIDLNRHTTWDALKREIDNRISRLCSVQSAKLVLCQWRVQGVGPLWDELVLMPEDSLRDCFRSAASRSCDVWPRGIDLVPSARQIEQWCSDARVSLAMDEWAAIEPGNLRTVPDAVVRFAERSRMHRAGIRRQIQTELVRTMACESAANASGQVTPRAGV